MFILNAIKNKIKYLKKRNQLQRRLKKDFDLFNKTSTNLIQRFQVMWNDKRPIYEDSVETSFDTHYFYHTAWAARIIAKTRPKKHIDISSMLYFPGIISAFVPVEFYDYRPALIKGLNNLTSEQSDITNLPFANDSIESLSCLHVIEHIGLGRYGDAIDPSGDIKAINELKRITAKGGDLLFVVPIGKPKIVFNAHRIYGYSQIIEYFGGFELKDFSLIKDDARQSGIISNATKEEADKQNYGCGCFWFKK